MPIDLNFILNKKLESKQGTAIFTFETVGDQLVFRFLARRTVKTARGEESDLIEAEVLGGTKFDKQTKQYGSGHARGARFFPVYSGAPHFRCRATGARRHYPPEFDRNPSREKQYEALRLRVYREGNPRNRKPGEAIDRRRR
jgi:hypothetical protein